MNQAFGCPLLTTTLLSPHAQTPGRPGPKQPITTALLCPLFGADELDNAIQTQTELPQGSFLNHLIELPCFWGERQRGLGPSRPGTPAGCRHTLRLAFWLWDQDRLGLGLCYGAKLPAVALEALLTMGAASGTKPKQFPESFCQAWGSAVRWRRCSRELPHSSRLKKKTKMNKKMVLLEGDGMCTLTFCFPFHVLSNPETRTNCS